MPIYGIDLGTTNSLIGLHKTGFLSPIVPSCVNMETGEAGAAFFEDMNAKRSFKVDMSMGTEGITPRIASQHVLEALKAQVTDDVVKEVVISVPAYFTDGQRTATLIAAEQAGLDVKALVNEPTAAAMYIAHQKRGLYVVYDLGGGTFDCSIIDSRFDTFDVQATDGCKIGGDNFDANIMRYCIKNGSIRIQELTKQKRMELQHYCSKAKIYMQKNNKPFNLTLSKWSGKDIEFTPETYKSIMKMTFADTINCLQKLMAAWVPSNEVCSILLVGGSTHCPYLREWITEVTGRVPEELTYDPDRVVAQGAALYADLVEKGEVNFMVSDVTKQLGIGLYDGTVEIIVGANSKVPLSLQKMVTNKNDTDVLTLDLYQGNSIFTKDNELIGTLEYKYGRDVPAMSGQVIVQIDIDSSGIIKLSARELLGEPRHIILRRKD